MTWYGWNSGGLFSAYGYAPMSAVIVNEKTMTVHFDSRQLVDGSYDGEPGSFSGTFKIYEGLDSYVTDQSGNVTNTTRSSCGFAPTYACTYSQKFTGHTTYSSATFDGTIGGFVVQAPPGNYNATWTVQSGLGSFVYSTN